MVMSDLQKQLRIKTGVCKRLKKDVIFYQKEQSDQEKKIEKMVSDGKCEYDIKKQREVLDETKAMIPDGFKRLETGYDDLKTFLATNKGNEAIEGCELFPESQKIFGEVTAFLGYDDEAKKDEEEEEY